MTRQSIKGTFAGAILSALCLATTSNAASNPVMWADIPDPSIIRVGNNYYMSHTTMHFAPGVPIMKSTDLVNWKTINYCYSTLTNNDNMNLNAGKTAYGKGSWAASIRHKDGTFHVLVPSYTTNKTHLYSTTDIEKGPWKETQFSFYHDPSLHLDEDGRNFVVYGGGDIKLVQLNAGLTGTQSGGINKTIIGSAALKALIGNSPILVGEGSHIEKINGWYYVFIICWPNGGGFDGRTELVFRSKTIDGTYEGKVVHSSKGVAQGSVLQDPAGKWWGYLFQDNGSVGRSTWIMPVTWANDWPSFNGGVSPTTFTIATNSAIGTGFVTNDDFNSTNLKLEWQWNHNPDNTKWSLSARPGFMRITTGRTDAQVVNAKNTLTQRSFGPTSSGRVSLDVSGLKDGDVAGLVALQGKYGYIGVKKTGTTNTLVMVNAGNTTPTEVATAPLSGNKVFLRIDMNFQSRTDKATFYYSTDSINWTLLGNTLQMSYELTHFTGYRFGLFAYSTKTAGGTADFDWFKIGATYKDSIELSAIAPRSGSTASGQLLTYRWDRQSSSIALRYTLAQSGKVGFRLVDARGKVVARLSERFQETGDHLVDLKGADLRDGSYFLVGQLNGATWGSWPVAIAR
ncbi:MAG: glycoside hydrolase 43 family protein [Fibrobacteres bacterium]|nr:glycoside hydrolase 43 family protein [Fibrobacterota bacterium]